MKTVRASAVLLAAALVVTAAACTGRGPGGPPGTVPRPGRTALLEYRAAGGNCPPATPGCGPVEVVIGRDGAWRSSVGSERREGRLDAASLRLTTNLIEHGADTLDGLPTAPPNLACPSSYDGQDVTITYHLRSRPVTVTNCDRVDPSRSKSLSWDNGLIVQTFTLAGYLSSGPRDYQPLIEWRASGGHCREACPRQQVSVMADGRWTRVVDLEQTHGQLDPATTESLRAAVGSQFDSLADLGPSTGCPSAYDGRDVLITYADGRRIGTVANCILDFGANPLIDRTATVVAAILGEGGS
jgi:hypothetical protein